MAALYLVFEGDSITSGLGLTGWQPYPMQVAQRYTDRMVSITNVATSGNTLATIATQAAVEVDPCYDARKGNNITIIFAGTNDLALGSTGASVYAALVSYGQARKAVGEKVVAVTCLPRTNAGIDAGFETQRLIYNASIRSGWTSFSDAMADLNTDSRLQNSNDGTYFQDQIHPNAVGAGILAGIVKAAIDTI